MSTSVNGSLSCDLHKHHPCSQTQKWYGKIKEPPGSVLVKSIWSWLLWLPSASLGNCACCLHQSLKILSRFLASLQISSLSCYIPTPTPKHSASYTGVWGMLIFHKCQVKYQVDTWGILEHLWKLCVMKELYAWISEIFLYQNKLTF